MDTLLRAKRVFTACGLGVFEPGAVGIEGGKISFVGRSGDIGDQEATNVLSFPESTVCPGLVDCHTHLMESAAYSLHFAQGSAQGLAAKANLMTALKSGITALGDHALADSRVPQSMDFYLRIAAQSPFTVQVAFGVGVLGTDPPAIGCSAVPRKSLQEEDLTPYVLRELATASQFPGENIFLNATPADLPLDLTPRAGERVLSYKKVEEIINIFHSCGKKVGAHAEGDSAVLDFLSLNGDTLHHAHGISRSVLRHIADKGVNVVMTPHGGTSATPNSPDDLLLALTEGVRVAIASDSYLPVHSKAVWISHSPGTVLGPADFMSIAGSVLRPLLTYGHSKNDLLQTFTLNGAHILGLEDRLGSLQPGKLADILVCNHLPALETVDINDIQLVMCKGEIVVRRIL